MTLITRSMAVVKAISANRLWKCGRWGTGRRKGRGWGAPGFFPAFSMMFTMHDPLPLFPETFLYHLWSLSLAAHPSEVPLSPAGVVSLLCLGCPASIRAMLHFWRCSVYLSLKHLWIQHPKLHLTCQYCIFLRAIFINTLGEEDVGASVGLLVYWTQVSASVGVLPGGVPPTQGGTDPQNWGISSPGTSSPKWYPC